VESASDSILGAAIADDEADFGGCQHHVERVHHGAHLEDAVVGDDPLPAIARIERHAVARLDAHGLEGIGEAAGERVDLRETEPAPLEDERGRAAEPRGGHGGDLGKVLQHPCNP